jgi:3-phenylpropionate/trans-cinnamate dioxygenase ferredoxin reductase component
MAQFVMVGGGHTSASATRSLRRHGFDGSIVIVGEEARPPYQRPPLSKEYLQGEAEDDELWSVEPGWYAENDVELHLGARVESIDRENLDVVLADATRIPADSVLIATGGRPRLFPGVEQSERILYLRTFEDSLRLKEHLGAGKHLIVVGAGFIGSEVAASARILGTQVTVLEGLPNPLDRVLGSQMGEICARIHLDQGVDLRCNVTVSSIEDKDGAVLVRTGDGAVIEGDAVVIGIGIQPNVEVAQASEITVGNGIRVDEFGRTSLEGVFAAGDVANHQHPLFGRRMRVEHFDNASRHGALVARNMLAKGLADRQRYVEPHWFWSDQYDLSLQYAGHAEEWDEIVIRGSVDDRDFIAFYMKDGLIEAVFGVDRGGDVMMAKSLIAERKPFDPEALRDDDIDLESLLLGPAEDEDEEEDAPQQALGNFRHVGRSGKVGEGIVRRFEVEGVEIAIARSGGQVYALDNYCTHLACHLSSGKVEDGGMVCLCHGSIFDLATGEPINPPATRPVKSYPAKEEDGQIYVAID